MSFEQSKPEPNPRDFEKQLAQKVRDELRQQPHVDGETWQFQGDSGEWVSFPASLNVSSMF